MDRHELMVCDWIETLNQNKEVCRVQVNEIQEKQVSFSYMNHYYLGASYENIKPIPLTEKIIFLNGFRLDEEWDEYRIELNKTYFSLEYDARKESYITISTYSKPIYIKYVHELQHLLRLCGWSDMADNFKLE